jgi:hypothetical protein
LPTNTFFFAEDYSSLSPSFILFNPSGAQSVPPALNSSGTALERLATIEDLCERIYEVLDISSDKFRFEFRRRTMPSCAFDSDVPRCRIRTENTERAYLAVLRPKQKSETEPQPNVVDASKLVDKALQDSAATSGRASWLQTEWNTPKSKAKVQQHPQADKIERRGEVERRSDVERREARHLQGSPQLHGALDRLHRLRRKLAPV